MLRLLSNSVIEQILEKCIFCSEELNSVIEFLGVLIQATDDFNLVVLIYLTRSTIRNQIPQLLKNINENILKSIIKIGRAHV